MVFDSEDAARGAQQYKEECESLAILLKTMPERGRVWTNEIRSSHNIDYWILTTDFEKANNELALYTSLFGPGTDFDRWFAGTEGKIRTWQNTIQQKQSNLPDKPDLKKKRPVKMAPVASEPRSGLLVPGPTRELDKKRRLDELENLYKQDKITAHQYFEMRTKILGEP